MDFKMLIGLVVVFGALAAGWWLGWFAPATRALMELKRNSIAVHQP